MAVQPTFKYHEILKSLKRIPGVRPVATFFRLASRDVYRRSFVLRKFPRESVGAEIGVHKGDFSEQMLRIVHPTKLHLIDPWKHESAEEYRQAYYGGMASAGQAELDKRYNEVCRRFHRQIKFGRVAVHRGYSFDVAGTFPDEYFDWVYIDGNHLYDYVKGDLESFYRKVTPGGYIAGDDYKVGGWWKSGVKLAVDEFLEKPTVQLVDIRNDQFILRKLS